jgi:hypothetical protein
MFAIRKLSTRQLTSGRERVSAVRKLSCVNLLVGRTLLLGFFFLSLVEGEGAASMWGRRARSRVQVYALWLTLVRGHMPGGEELDIGKIP